jgi:hypothetical protein
MGGHDPPRGSWKPKYKMRNWTESRNSSSGISSVSNSNWSDINNSSSVFVFCLHVDGL